MPSFSQELVAAAKSRYGSPFLDHFKPEDRCCRGAVTTDACWERGLDGAGYDCSGFVIASICDVLKISVDRWPRDRRHVIQLLELASESLTPEPGDVVITFDPVNTGRRHMGIYTGSGRMLHADGRSSSPYINEAIIDTGAAVRALPSSLLSSGESNLCDISQ